MEDFIKLSEFQKMVTFTPIKTWRIFNKLCRENVLKKEIDWKKEAGEIYVIPSRLFLEAQKLRPEIEYLNVKSNDFKTISNEITPEKKKEQFRKETKKKPSRNKDSLSEIKRFQMKSDEITELLKERVEELKEDKTYLQKQVGEKTEENKNLQIERTLVMKDWRDLVEENDNLRRMLTSGENEATEKPKGTHQESESQVKDRGVAGEEKSKSSNHSDNEADQKKVNKTKNISKNIPKPKRKRGDDVQIGETIPKKPNQTPQNKQGKKPTKTKDKLKSELRVKSKPEREPETKENHQPKKFKFWKWLLG